MNIYNILFIISPKLETTQTSFSLLLFILSVMSNFLGPHGKTTTKVLYLPLKFSDVYFLNWPIKTIWGNIQASGVCFSALPYLHILHVFLFKGPALWLYSTSFNFLTFPCGLDQNDDIFIYVECVFISFSWELL